MSKAPQNMKSAICYNYNVGKEYICPSSFENIPFKSELAQDYMYSDWFKAVNAGRNIKCADVGCGNKYYRCGNNHGATNDLNKNTVHSEQSGGGCSCNKFPLHTQNSKPNLNINTGMIGGGCGCTGTPSELLAKLPNIHMSGGGSYNAPLTNMNPWKSCGCKEQNRPVVPNFNLLRSSESLRDSSFKEPSNGKVPGASLMHGGCFPMCLIGGGSNQNAPTIPAFENNRYEQTADPSSVYASTTTDNYPRNTCNTHLDPNSKNCGFMKYDQSRIYNSDSDKYVEGNYFNLCQGQIGKRPIVGSHDNNLKIPKVLMTSCPNFVGKTVNCQQPFWGVSCI